MFRRSAIAVAVAVVLALAACTKEADKWVGRYEVDRDEVWKAWREDIEQNKPEYVDAMRDAVDTLRFDLDIEADGTFKTSSLMLTDGLPTGTESSIDSSGTWNAVGETITLTVTKRNGESVEGVISGSYRDGVLRLNMGPGLPVVLRKRGAR